MYLVTLMTVKVLMLARPKSRVKKPSTWGAESRAAEACCYMLGIQPPRPRAASALSHSLISLLTGSRRRTFPPRVLPHPEIQTETFIRAVLRSQQLD